MLTCQSADSPLSSSSLAVSPWQVCNKVQKVTTTSCIFQVSISLSSRKSFASDYLESKQWIAKQCLWYIFSAKAKKKNRMQNDAGRKWSGVIVSIPAAAGGIYTFVPLLLDPSPLSMNPRFSSLHQKPLNLSYHSIFKESVISIKLLCSHHKLKHDLYSRIKNAWTCCISSVVLWRFYWQSQVQSKTLMFCEI